MKLHELYDAMRVMMDGDHRDAEVTVVTMVGDELVADEVEECSYDSNQNIVEIFGRSTNQDAAAEAAARDEDDDPAGEDPGLLVP